MHLLLRNWIYRRKSRSICSHFLNNKTLFSILSRDNFKTTSKMSKCCDWHTQIICQFTYLHIFSIFWVWYLTHQKFSFKIPLSKLLFITELRQRMEFQKETAIVVVSIGWIQRRNEQRRSNNEATKASTHVCNLVL